jgi:hypothetical protein
VVYLFLDTIVEYLVQPDSFETASERISSTFNNVIGKHKGNSGTDWS